MKNSFIETGYLKAVLEFNTGQGPMSKEDSEKIQDELSKFFKKKGWGVEGRMSYVKIETIERQFGTYEKLDTTPS